MSNDVKGRVPMPELSVEKRITTFDEVPLGYSKEQAIIEAKRCLQCKEPPCIKKCPVQVNVKEFVKELATGNLNDAFFKIKQDNPIPAIAGRVCPQESQCEGACTLGKAGAAINIGKLESFLGSWAMAERVRDNFSIKENGKKVAIIGSGPSSISCAVDLRKYGYKVSMFEALHKAGGVLQYGIPEFRLPKKIVDEELAYLMEIGVNIRLNHIVGQNVSFKELRNDYDAIYVGTGAGASFFVGIEGEELNGVYSANEFLIRTNLMKAYDFPEYDTPLVVGKKVGVIGSGNVAMDSARSARRFGSEVYVLYRRTKDCCPAREEELRHALEEGIHFIELVAPKKILGKDGWVKGIELQRMKLGKPDRKGRPRPEKIEGSEFIMELDTVIEAIGTTPNRLFLRTVPELKTTANGFISVDDKLMNVEGVYAGGDAISGGATVIEALGEGRKAAKSIHEYLSKS